MAVGCLGLVALPVAANASAAHLPTLKKGLDFYRGQTLTIIQVGSIGGAADTEALALVPFLANYLHAKVIIETQSASNGIAGQDSIAAARPDGLTIGMLMAGTDIQLEVTNTPGLNFNPVRLAWLGGNGGTVEPFLAAASSPYKTFAQVLAAQTPIPTLTFTQGLTNVTMRAFYGILGVHNLWISGYQNSAAVLQGFVRGDGILTTFPAVTALPLITSRSATLLFVSGKAPVGVAGRATWNSVPTFAQLFRQYPVKTQQKRNAEAALLAIVQNGNQPLVTGTKVPDYKVEALRAAIAWTFRQQAFRTQMLLGGQNDVFETPAVAKAAYILASEKGAALACYIEATACG